jgi:hypothetical protein
MHFSEPVLKKARKLIGSERVSRDQQFDAIWWVKSSASDHTYRVQSDFDRVTRKLSWVTCTCPHGLNVGAGTASCYHVAAVLMLLRDEQTEDGVPPEVLVGSDPGFIGPRREERADG